MQIRDATLGHPVPRARDVFFFPPGRVPAIPRENAPVPTRRSRGLTARARYTRVVSDAGTLPHTRENARLQSRRPDAPRRVSGRRCALRRDRQNDAATRNSASGAERAHGERAACLPRESHSQLCATIAMGRLGSESKQACLPRATEPGRDLPRSTYEGTQHDGRGRGSTTTRSNGRARARPELNLKFTDGDIARAQSRRGSALNAQPFLLFAT